MKTTQDSDSRTGHRVLGVFIDALAWDETLARISSWAAARESRYTCICNVHSVVEAMEHDEFMRILNDSDMATPDGMPLVWMLRRFGFDEQQRINGPDLMWRYCALAETRGEAVYCYGSTEETLKKLCLTLTAAFPALKIAGVFSPPFRALSETEDREIVDIINGSGAGVVFVGLGCPKQEKWMAAHRGRIRAVMIGVGAAFDYHAGNLTRAPMWMQRIGLEWLHRLGSEPRRLWRRYLVTNTLFVIGVTRQLFFSGRKDQ